MRIFQRKTNETKETKRKHTVGWVKLWDNYLSNIHNRDDSEDAAHPLRDYQLYSDFSATFSKRQKISVYFSIDSFNRGMDLNYRLEIRQQCGMNVRVNFIDLNEPYMIDWTNRETKNRFRIWSSIDQNIQSSDINEYNYYENIDSLDENELRKQSLMYISDAVKRRQREMFKTQQIMIISGDRGKDFDKSLQNIVATCARLQINITRLTGDISDYLAIYSPFALNRNTDIERTVGTNILPDEIISRYITYSQGKVGNGTLYWGSDIYTQFPVLSEPKRDSTDAEIWAVVAETGGGKSFLVKSLLLQLLARKDMVGTINDIENEYVQLAYLVKADDHDNAKIIDFGSDQGNYFDAVEIYLTGNADLDSTMYEDSYNLTVEVFKTLGISQKGLEREDELTEWMIQIIKQGVADTYKDAGVFATDMKTWRKSKGLRYYAVYEHIRNVNRQNNEVFQKAKDLLLAKLASYFDENGAHAGKFTEEKRITIDQIIDSKLVINKFGLQGRSGNELDETQLALMQLYTTQIGHIRSVFAKAQGKYNFKVFEEVQRWAKMRGSADILNATITGERKLGTITIVVSNKASELLDNDTLGVFQNYTSIAVGAIADADVRRRLCERISMPLMTRELDQIAKESKVTGEDSGTGMQQSEIENNMYAKSFMVYLNRSEYAICKVRLPHSISNSDLFRTGVKLADDEPLDEDIAESY